MPQTGPFPAEVDVTVDRVKGGHLECSVGGFQRRPKDKGFK